MSWKDNLQPGKFRNAPFLFGSTDAELGRRVQLHEYPGRDLPFAEDLGRKARRWSLELYVLGRDYMAARDALIAALEQPGPGALVHPYLGSLQVVVIEARGPRESTREGGLARFSVTFAEAGDNLYPSGVANSSQNVSDKAQLSNAQIRADFSYRFSISERPDYVATAAEQLISRAMATISQVSNAFPAVPAEAVKFVRGLGQASGGIAGLIRQPADLAAAIGGLVIDLARLPERPKNAINAYRVLGQFGQAEAVVPRNTPTRRQQSDNQAAVLALVHQSALVAAAEVASGLDYDSYQEAIGLRDELADRLDEEMSTASDPVFFALQDLRAALVRDLSGRPELARLVRYTPAATLPALVVAYQLYGDAGREAEIVSRNRLRHPGFVPGGQALEVLTDA